LHKRRLIILLLFVLLTASVSAQVDEKTKKIDSTTYNLYILAKWSDLIDAGTAALDEGIDFYFLRMRIGIAYYNRKNYMSAIGHFEQALEYSPREPAALEYLYWSYIFSGREKEARVLASGMTDELRKTIGAGRNNFVGGFYTEVGITFTGDSKNTRGNPGSDTTIYSGQKSGGKSAYFSFNLELSPWKRMTVFLGYNYLDITSDKYFGSTGNSQESFKVSTKQNEYYLNTGIYAGAGFIVNGIFHYLNINVGDVSADANAVNSNTVFKKTSTSLNNYVGMISIGKSAGCFNLTLGSSYSNLNKAKQIQNNFTVVYYPLGNLDLYSVSDFVVHSEKQDPAGKSSSKFLTRGIVNQKIGFKVLDRLWLEAFYMFGNAVNYHENNAFVVFNSSDIMSDRFGVNLISPVSSNIMLSLRYQQYKQDVPELVYGTQTLSANNFKSYTFHKLIGTLKWTF